MKCYKCSSEMKRKALEGVLVDACPACEGIWLDGGELKMQQEGDRKNVDEILAMAKSEITSEKKRLVSLSSMCPRCQQDGIVEKVVAGTALDVCPSCAGIHFDWSELTKVLRHTDSIGFSGLVDKVRESLREE